MAEVKLEEHMEHMEHRHCSGGAHIKEDPELCIKQELEEFHIVTVKTEDEESPVLHHREDTDGAEEHTDSSDTDRSEDYSQDQASTKRSYAMIAPDSSVTEHRPYSCSHCGKSFRFKSSFQRHSVVHSKSCYSVVQHKPYSCSVCGKMFGCNSEVQRHMRVHSDERPHKCSVCEKAFKYKGDVNKHMKIHSRQKTCAKSFNGTSELTKPKESAHQINSVHTKSLLKVFLLKKHETTRRENPDSSVSDLRSFSCSQCGKSFRFKSRLEKHMAAHSHKKPHKCSFCKKGFKYKCNLQEHMKIHSVTDCRPHSCSQCGKRFKWRSALKLHMRIHSDERCHKCSVCEKDLHLKNHCKPT